jgi:HAE1 family hydrophobic/amphiphilic exporter-1
MLFGTVFGVILIPGLYFIFANFGQKHMLIENEEENPLTEEIK